MKQGAKGSEAGWGRLTSSFRLPARVRASIFLVFRRRFFYKRKLPVVVCDEQMATVFFYSRFMTFHSRFVHGHFICGAEFRYNIDRLWEEGGL